MKKLIYISGKMGEETLSEATIAKFKKAEEKLTKEGWAVINPADEAYQKHARRVAASKECKFVGWYDIMLLYDLQALAIADAIYMLKDWRDSPGATAEYYYAKACNKEIRFEEDEKS